MLFARILFAAALAASLGLAQPRQPVHRQPHPRPDPVVLTSSDVAAVVQADGGVGELGCDGDRGHRPAGRHPGDL